MESKNVKPADLIEDCGDHLGRRTVQRMLSQEGIVPKLQTVAKALEKCVGAMGSTIRYGGDEFVVLLNTQLKESIENCIDSINKALDEINAFGEKTYLLSLSIGYDSLDIKNQTLEDLLSKSDKKMYEAKTKYYINHNRRKSVN